MALLTSPDPLYIRIYYFTLNKYFFIVKLLYYLNYKIFENKIFRYTNKPRILYISFITGGGLKKHIYELANCDGLSNNFDIWIMLDNGWIIRNNKKFRTVLSLKEVIDRIQPDIIHIHQLSKDLDECDMIPWERCIITTHDLFYVCPHFFMVECFDRFCHPSNCSKEWRDKMHSILMRCRCIVCPSRSVKDMLTFYYPDIEDKIMIIEHGI